MPNDLTLDQVTCLQDIPNLAPSEYIKYSHKPASALSVLALNFRISELSDTILAGKINVDLGGKDSKPKFEAEELIAADKALDDADVPAYVGGEMLTLAQRIKMMADD